MSGVIENAEYQSGQQNHDHTAADKAKFFADNGKNGIGIFGGQAVALGLAALQITGSQQLARTQGQDASACLPVNTFIDGRVEKH